MDEKEQYLYASCLLAAAERRLMEDRVNKLETTLLRRIEGLECRQLELLELSARLNLPADHPVHYLPGFGILGADSPEVDIRSSCSGVTGVPETVANGRKRDPGVDQP